MIIINKIAVIFSLIEGLEANKEHVNSGLLTNANQTFFSF